MNNAKKFTVYTLAKTKVSFYSSARNPVFATEQFNNN